MIKIDVLGIEWKPCQFIENKKLRLEVEKFLAKRFIELIKISVEQQRYASKWDPLSRRYLDYKISQGLSTKTWEATGELISKLKFNERTMSIGWDGRGRHKQSGSSYILIARSLEYGSLTGIPPRPLFRTVYWYMRKNVRYFYDKFIEENL